MSRRRASHSESIAQSSTTNEAFAYPYSAMQQNQQAPRRGPIEGPNGRRLIRRVTWRSSTYKLMASLWVFGVFYIVWLIRDIFYLPFSSSTHSANGAPALLEHYVGHRECAISSSALYTPPRGSDHYCQTRDALLSAMSNGGRHGFDAAYTSQGCFYRWYTASEACEILQRFDGVAFVGDESLADVYAGFNILLRQDLKSGSLKDWETSPQQLEKCDCDAQFRSASCLALRITSSEEVYRPAAGATARRPYGCSSRLSHDFITVTSSPASKATQERFQQLVARTESQSANKPIAVVHSLSLSTSYSLSAAQSSMDEWLALAQSTNRDTPFLWVGPTAPGHKKPSTENGLASSWQYTLDAAEAARSRGIETLGMYNATLQAGSWDGVHYGEKVALMQAMMILNWLSAL